MSGFSAFQETPTCDESIWQAHTNWHTGGHGDNAVELEGWIPVGHQHTILLAGTVGDLVRASAERTTSSHRSKPAYYRTLARSTKLWHPVSPVSKYDFATTDLAGR
jgi:hypothetical protein